MAKRSRSSIGQAVARLGKEHLQPLGELTDLAGVSEEAMRRWAVDGLSGRYMDALHRPGVGWMSSQLAVLRFIAEVRAVEATSPPGLRTRAPTTSRLLK